ncbi:3-isopropylmalate dehydratase large subunit [Flavobacteriaceae bacterium]|jgi:3-isopropylmalate/(R)-2-methylmalate dehydratase large subunit|nr:3-isopropylmalate dehydratase large subunit [Flavobacteriaceae bacterium]MBT4313413.1 3-isopropylmalate dehydratase large subunit [Flavobacteriaceae bacterium]MBT5092452.1 3-isopropylmalate dehydratase large subunit [Flavobacteriaceae bacterium]MBT5283193.1 3-isopropylmalate dehydratase large subunit [Flavobacteriaceae bacterium]MBT5447137.1 3-isopropylmalate dehydratase large subunit [Flavobacteriaceae bacterium]|tara:strand:+ start:10367 stop:11764 length:1398 start_codon:yes stop_codon:yes gene_type:complete
MKQTLFDKVWDSHVVKSINNGPDVLFIDRHMIHEVTSPVAFLGLKNRKLPVLYPERTFATADHNTPTLNQHLPVADPLSRNQLKALEENATAHGISYWGLGHKKNGIVHVVGPEYGITQPGATIVCGDSHTSTHGAFGAIAFGIGTSEVEMVLATQCIMQPKPKKMRISINGSLNHGVTPKDVALFIISKLTTSGATGYFVEYAGEVFEQLSMEGRMTVCNLSIEMGARGGMIAPDEKTFEYIKGREFTPQGSNWDKAMAYWKTLYTDEGATFDKELTFDGAEIDPMITFGTNPGMGMSITKVIPTAASVEGGAATYKKSLDYMGYNEGESMIGKPIDFVFIGSCTNGRIEDFRAFASIVKGKKRAKNVTAWLVPGSHKVLASIKEEGLLEIFEAAEFELREPGCSACLAMNDDKIPAGKYAVSTSNRNFEGRQGPGSRTLLASPLVAAAAAITGKITDPRTLIQ